MAQKSGAADATAAVPFVSRGIMLWSLGGIMAMLLGRGTMRDPLPR